MKTRVGVSSSSKLAARAGGDVARAGGNAVDAAIAASLVSAISEPGMVSLGAGGYLTIWPVDGDPISIDGGVEMPGRTAPPDRFGGGAERVYLDYIGGLEALIGAGTVGTPGALAGYAEASRRFGALPWAELVAPAIDIARSGFPMGRPSHRYLSASHEAIYSRDADSKAALHDAAGQLLPVGETIHVPHLADSLQQIAEEGAETFYRGDLAQVMGDCVMEQGGIMSRNDLAAYEPRVTPALQFDLQSWKLATVAPSSIGGGTLGAMVCQALSLAPLTPGDRDWTREVARIQNEVLTFRSRELDVSPGFESLVRSYFDETRKAQLKAAIDSPSTVHTSATDVDGNACAITISAGYGSGVMPPGTGIWLNNCLGELELNCTGYHSLAPGARLLSNMAPSAGRGPSGEVLAIGSPGSGRITTAQFQTLLNLIVGNLPLAEAIAQPRLHIEEAGGVPIIRYEPGLSCDELPGTWQPEAALDTYFGGVGAVALRSGQLEGGVDPRRSGAVAFG